MDPLSPLEEFEFERAFDRAQQDMAATNLKNGFSEDDALIDVFEAVLDERAPDISDKYRKIFTSFRSARIGLKLMLIVSELGELLEGVRKKLGGDPDEHCPDFTNEEVELADVVIRAMNYAKDRNLRLGGAIVAKNRFNRNRKDHDRARFTAEHGKQF